MHKRPRPSRSHWTVVHLVAIVLSAALTLRTGALLSHYPAELNPAVAYYGSSGAEWETPCHKYTLCAMTRVRNLPRTVAEWIEYHTTLGVGHFFIVDDCSTDEGRTRAVLDVYRQEGLVTLYDAEDVSREECGHLLPLQPYVQKGELMPTANGQDDAAYQSCRYACKDMHTPDEHRLLRFLFGQIQRSEMICDWVMAFDPDEYLTLQTDLYPSGRVIGGLRTFFAQYTTHTSGFPVLHVPWVIMGSDHQEQRPPGLIIDNFRRGSYPAWMIKTAARTSYVDEWGFSHWPTMQNISAAEVSAKHGFTIPEPFASLREYTERNVLLPNESRVVVMYPNTSKSDKIECRLPASPLFLKHYLYRSFEEFQAYRANPDSLRVKSDGGENEKPLNEPRRAWEEGWGVHNPRSVEGPCAEVYGNDFTASMADGTRTRLAARRRHWNDRHREKGKAWMDCGREGKKQCYQGPFPPIEEWVV